MARALGKNSEADRWLEDAAAIQTAILNKLYAPDDAAFYDLDAQNHFVRVRSDVISRVLGEYVVDQKLFDAIYEREIHNPKAFGVPYPLPSIALDDPAFVHPIPRNSWGGASQALSFSYRLQITPTRTAAIKYVSGRAELCLNDKPLYQTSSVVRLVTDLDGKLESATGIAPETIAVLVRQASGQERKFSIRPNESKYLSASTSESG